MVKSKQFTIVYPTEIKAHLKAIERKYHPLIRQTIKTQLQFEPDIETRNRKPLNQPAILEAEWEIRFGPNNRFRVLYEVDRSEMVVYILAIGVKERDRLLIAGKVVEK